MKKAIVCLNLAILVFVPLNAFAGQRVAQQQVVPSPGGETLALFVGQTGLKIIDINGSVLLEKSFDTQILEAAFSPDGEKLALCLSNGQIILNEIQKKSTANIDQPSGDCGALEWTKDSQKLIYAKTTSVAVEKAPGILFEVKIFSIQTGKTKTIYSTKSKANLP